MFVKVLKVGIILVNVIETTHNEGCSTDQES